MRAIGKIFCLALILWSGTQALPQGKAGEPEVKVIKYDQLKEAVLKNRGKVVLVDFWFTL
jgi:hypothetical protein